MSSTKHKQKSPKSAADLIAGAKAKPHASAGALRNYAAAKADLELICTWNDSPGVAPITREETIALLRESHGWKYDSKEALNTLCRRALGRKSFGVAK